MKAMKKNDMGVSPVIAVILMVAITVVLAGVVFLWAQSFTDDAGGGVETMNVRAVIDDDATATTDTLTFEIISGAVEWDNYYVKIDGTTETAGTPASGTSNAGDSAVFSWVIATENPFTAGTSYNIKIVNIADNTVVWENDIIAK